MDVKGLRAVALVGVAGLAVVLAPAVSGQSARPEAQRRIDIFRADGSHIGASVRDLDGSEVKEGGGVYVEDVRSDGPAARAGLQRGDVVTRFDGETIRSVRQFSRLVQETPPGRTVQATVRREGRATELSVTPEEGFRARLPLIDFDFGLQGLGGRSRLGVTVEELSPQLAAFFGAKDGVLVTTVAPDSPASRAGLKAGDVIVSLNGQTVTSSGDLLRGLRSAGSEADVAVGVVRDKKETSIKARLEDGRVRRPVRPIRPVRAIPA